MTRSVKKIVGLSVSRKEKIKLRIDEMGGWEQACATLATCFRKINESDFCNGKGDKKWVASFDWFFINDKNWTKVIEGNYDNMKETTPLDKLSENIAKADEYYEQRYRGYGGASAYGNPAGRRSDGPDEQ